MAATSTTYCPVCNTGHAQHDRVCRSCGYAQLMPSPTPTDRAIFTLLNILPLVVHTVLMLAGIAICASVLAGVTADRGLAIVLLVVGAIVTLATLLHAYQKRNYLLGI